MSQLTVPLVTPQRFRRFETPASIVPVINREHRGALMAIAMCSQHPRIFTRDQLMAAGNFSVARQGPLCAFTAFHWWILRINDWLPRTGWRVNDFQNYRLTQITREHAAWLEWKLNRRGTA